MGCTDPHQGQRRRPIRIKDNGAGDNFMKLLGWSVTAGALSFGAPFWFNLLSKVGPLRNAKAPRDNTGVAS